MVRVLQYKSSVFQNMLTELQANFKYPALSVILPGQMVGRTFLKVHGQVPIIHPGSPRSFPKLSV